MQNMMGPMGPQGGPMAESNGEVSQFGFWGPGFFGPWGFWGGFWGPWW